jgi:hypothetical protein
MNEEESPIVTRQRRVTELGTLVAQHVPDELLIGSDHQFEMAMTAIEYSTLGEVVRDAIAYGDFAPDEDEDE